ncbi:MATE family efflux transporter [Desulforhopalus sp. 52FAK]
MNDTNTTATRNSALLDSKYWEFFVPTILMAMTLTMSIVVDSIIVGNMLGADALAAVNLVMPLIMSYNTVAVCLGLGAATLISIAKGRRDPDYANSVFTTVLFFLALISLLLLACQVTFIDQINQLLTREPSLRPLVKSYVHVLMYGTPLIVIVPGLAYCLRVDGQVKLASTVLIVANLVNLALDLVYMGPFNMGIAGSSLATVSGYFIGALCLLPYVFSKTRTLHFVPGALTHMSELLSQLGTIVKTGFPAAMGSILITFKILSINHIVLAVADKSGMVAFSVCISCLSFVSMFISGAAQAMTPIVGVLYGEKDYTGVRFIVRRAFITLMIASIAATLLLEIFPAQILEIFGVRDTADIALGIPAIRIFSLSLIGTSTTFLSMYYYMTIGRTKLSTAIAIVQGAAVVPIALVLSSVMNISGVWIAFSLAEIVTILMIVVSYLFLTQKNPQKYTSPLLLDKEQLPKGPGMETTSRGDNFEETLQMLDEFLGSLENKYGIPVTVQKTIGETTAVCLKHLFGQEEIGYVDITLAVFEDNIILTMRDKGKHSTLTGNAELTRLLGKTCEIQHSQAIGFNNYTLTFDIT